jgi:glutathione S-transferase
MGLIYHIAFLADWKEAQLAGEYKMSTRGRTLEQQGFIHAGRAHQVAPVANAIYSRDDELLILVIDEGRVTPDIRYEAVPGWDEPFPHIYGPLNLDSVIKTFPLTRGADGRFAFAVGSM